MTWGVLLSLPVCLLVFLTESTLVLASSLRDESVVHLLRLETTSEVHRSDLFRPKGATEYIFAHIVFESCKDPVGGKVAAPTFHADLVMELDRVAFGTSCGFLARSIIATAR